jgi:hypothetical protein
MVFGIVYSFSYIVRSAARERMGRYIVYEYTSGGRSCYSYAMLDVQKRWICRCMGMVDG